MRKGKELLLGFSITYCILAIVQWIKPQLFPISLYLAIAWASLGMALIELFKSLIDKYRTGVRLIEQKIDDSARATSDEISLLQQCHGFEREIESNNAILSLLKDERKKVEKYRQTEKRLVFAEKVLSIVQIVFCCLMLIITPLKAVPNDLNNNKLLSILGLLSFALLFFSYYCRIQFDFQEETEKLVHDRIYSKYYLNLMNRMIEQKENNYAE
ncbi:MAG: hypothetical protein IKG32_00120 [Clostridia bacterium]|nr:hypothetical protein [Clostridia bacterium]